VGGYPLEGLDSSSSGLSLVLEELPHAGGGHFVSGFGCVSGSGLGPVPVQKLDSAPFSHVPIERSLGVNKFVVQVSIVLLKAVRAKLNVSRISNPRMIP